MSRITQDKDILDRILALERFQKSIETGVVSSRPDPRFLPVAGDTGNNWGYDFLGLAAYRTDEWDSEETGYVDEPRLHRLYTPDNVTPADGRRGFLFWLSGQVWVKNFDSYPGDIFEGLPEGWRPGVLHSYTAWDVAADEDNLDCGHWTVLMEFAPAGSISAGTILVDGAGNHRDLGAFKTWEQFDQLYLDGLTWPM